MHAYTDNNDFFKIYDWFLFIYSLQLVDRKKLQRVIDVGDVKLVRGVAGTLTARYFVVNITAWLFIIIFIDI